MRFCIILILILSLNAKAQRMKFDIEIDPELSGKKMIVSSCAILGIPPSLAKKHRGVFESIKRSSYPTVYDTLANYLQKTIILSSWRLQTVKVTRYNKTTYTVSPTGDTIYRCRFLYIYGDQKK